MILNWVCIQYVFLIYIPSHIPILLPFKCFLSLLVTDILVDICWLCLLNCISMLCPQAFSLLSEQQLFSTDVIYKTRMKGLWKNGLQPVFSLCLGHDTILRHVTFSKGYFPQHLANEAEDLSSYMTLDNLWPSTILISLSCASVCGFVPITFLAQKA